MPVYGSGASMSRQIAHPGFVVGRWYPALPGPESNGTATGTANTRMRAFYLPQAVTISDLALRVTTANAGNAGAAIYATDPALQEPTGSAPLASVLGLSTASTGYVSAALASPVSFAPGWYWMAVQCDNATAAFLASSNTDTGSAWARGVAALSDFGGSTSRVNLNYASTYGTWPSVTGVSPTLSTGAAEALLHFKVSGVA